MEDEYCLFSKEDAGELEVGMPFWNQSGFLEGAQALYILENGLQMFGVKELDGKLAELGMLNGVLAHLQALGDNPLGD